MSALARLTIACWDELQWRHHGTGMLQAYIPGSRDTRIHVWHPSLLLPGMSESGGMHNHRFALTSNVLFGQIDHARLDVTADKRGGHVVWDIGLASKSVDKDLLPIEYVTVRVALREVFGAGSDYTLAKWAYHHAQPLGLAMTLVNLIDKDEEKSASLLAPVGRRPVTAFRPQTDENAGMILDILTDARLELERCLW